MIPYLMLGFLVLAGVGSILWIWLSYRLELAAARHEIHELYLALAASALVIETQRKMRESIKVYKTSPPLHPLPEEIKLKKEKKHD